MRVCVCLAIATLAGGGAQAQAQEAKLAPVAGFRTDIVKCFDASLSASASLCAANEFEFPQNAAVSVGGGRVGLATKGGAIRWVLTADVRSPTPASDPNFNPLFDQAPATRGERASNETDDAIQLAHGAQDVVDVADASGQNGEQPLDRVGLEDEIGNHANDGAPASGDLPQGAPQPATPH